MLEDVRARPADAEALPSERLGGALAVIYLAAVAVLILPVIGLGAVVATGGGPGLAVVLAEAPGGPRRFLLALIPVLTLVVWAAAFVSMTTVRSRAAPTISSVLFAIWGFSSVAAQLAAHVLAADGPRLDTFGPALPGFAATLACVAAFLGYMREGERPRRWFVGS